MKASDFARFFIFYIESVGFRYRCRDIFYQKSILLYIILLVRELPSYLNYQKDNLKVKCV